MKCVFVSFFKRTAGIKQNEHQFPKVVFIIHPLRNCRTAGALVQLLSYSSGAVDLWHSKVAGYSEI